jgi:hypothetical protein
MTLILPGLILPQYEISLLILMIFAMLIGGIFHQAYLQRVQSIVKKTADSDFNRKDLMKALHISQGSNFNALMILSWSLFFVALVFLYFLTPDIFPDMNYFLFPKMASESYGLVVFGVALILIPGLLISLIVPRVYSYYLVSRWLKNLNLFTPLLLIMSLFCSANLATIYPQVDEFIWNLGYSTLLIALVLMLLPIIIGFVEELK